MKFLSVASNRFQDLGSKGHQLLRRASKQQILLFVALIISTLLVFRLIASTRHTAIPIAGSGKDGLILEKGAHPVSLLAAGQRSYFADLCAKQSKTLKEAVAEYRQRYKLYPPPHFDQWYHFASKNQVPLIDEYDDIHNALQPFRGLSPAAIRKRVKNALDADEFLIGLFIRNGKIKTIARGEKWKTSAIRNAVEPLAHLLPDMDIAFNMHDEPRVIIPHDHLALLAKHAISAKISLPPRSESWSASPADLNSGFLEPNPVTPFTEYAHQFTWPVSTLSCPPTSPARTPQYDGTSYPDDQSLYSPPPIRLVKDSRVFSDICLSPSFSERHGFFNMPNAWSITHDPIPIFSPSKISTFHDVLFPAPWYLANRVQYNDSKDLPWDSKKDVLYWRGSTTSGYSAGGVWHRQQRQRFVEAVEKPGDAVILTHDPHSNEWLPDHVQREEYKELFDVHFTYIGQCSEEDCDEQTDFFDVREPDDYDKNWLNKFLLDIDGNAFSGRFYTFLQSRSLILKQALFQEWHQTRVFPWLHFIPLGLNGSDHLELMRFFTRDESGKHLAQELAEESRKWASASLRQVDMQAWMFRLLLEYARLVDDAREHIGFNSA